MVHNVLTEMSWTKRPKALTLAHSENEHTSLRRVCTTTSFCMAAPEETTFNGQQASRQRTRNYTTRSVLANSSKISNMIQPSIRIASFSQRQNNVIRVWTDHYLIKCCMPRSLTVISNTCIDWLLTKQPKGRLHLQQSQTSSLLVKANSHRVRLKYTHAFIVSSTKRLS